jgi:hypothetical protein
MWVKSQVRAEQKRFGDFKVILEMTGDQPSLQEMEYRQIDTKHVWWFLSQ